MEAGAMKYAQAIRDSARIVDAMADDAELMRALGETVDLCIATLQNNGKILFMGNGGSAADAQHLAGELVSRFEYDRPALASIALTTDTSILTAIGNDYGYENLFSRQVQALGRPGDVLVGISTSGNSPNILKALQSGREMGLRTIGMTGNRQCRIGEFTDTCMRVPSHDTPYIQQGHIALGHILCREIDSALFPKGA